MLICGHDAKWLCVLVQSGIMKEVCETGEYKEVTMGQKKRLPPFVVTAACVLVVGLLLATFVTHICKRPLLGESIKVVCAVSCVIILYQSVLDIDTKLLKEGQQVIKSRRSRTSKDSANSTFSRNRQRLMHLGRTTLIIGVVFSSIIRILQLVLSIAGFNSLVRWFYIPFWVAAIVALAGFCLVWFLTETRRR